MPSRRSLARRLTQSVAVFSIAVTATGCILDWQRETSKSKDRSSVSGQNSDAGGSSQDPTDAGSEKAPSRDGSVDSGVIDSGVLDSGVLDSGVLDSGTRDGSTGCGAACPPIDPCAGESCPAPCDGCSIGGVCYEAGQKNPANECELCHPSTSTTGWQQPNGSACGDQTSSECDLPDTCSFGVCRSNFVATTFTCGGAPAACHEQDMCDGNGRCVDKGFKLAGRPCGNQSATDCDLADVCDGSGVCKPNFAPANAPCNTPGECEVQDRCNGAGACSDMGFKEKGTSCGYGGGNSCDLPDECDDAGRCDSNPTPSGYVCDDNDPCTGPDRCTGTGLCRGANVCN